MNDELKKEARFLLKYSAGHPSLEKNLKAALRKINTNPGAVDTAINDLNNAVADSNIKLHPREMDLSDIGLTRITDETVKTLRESADVRVLFLDNNNLKTLPESFGTLKNLFSVNLEDNKLTSLPESFGNLTKLKELYVDANPITKLPKSFSKLKLKEITVPVALVMELMK